jgi:putative tRNA adenosine deaminase-associated protein
MIAQNRQTAPGVSVSHFAAAAVRGADGWAATELDLNSAADLEDVSDRLRDVDPDALISLLFVEADDTYLAVLRLDEGEDLRVFGSDAGFVDESRLGALLLGDVKEPVSLDLDAVVGPEPAASGHDSDREAAEPAPVAPDVEPVGDPDLLADLGVSAQRLLALCGREGMLPADVTAEVCQIVGCGDEVEELREA